MLWFVNRAVLRAAVALALVGWGAIAALAYLEPPTPADGCGQCPMGFIHLVP